MLLTGLFVNLDAAYGEWNAGVLVCEYVLRWGGVLGWRRSRKPSPLVEVEGA
jgi:hypothetical protein